MAQLLFHLLVMEQLAMARMMCSSSQHVSAVFFQKKKMLRGEVRVPEVLI